MPDLSKFCKDCGQERGHHIDCPQHRLRGHKLDCKMSLGGKHCTCGYFAEKEKQKPKRLEIKQKMDGTTWMVSVIGPDQKDGSAWYSERAGRDAKQAAESYWKDPDNHGANVIDRHPEETLIVVIDQAIAPSGKQWHVHLFCVEGGKVVRFPG